MSRRVVLYGNPGCHLCDDARLVVERVCADLGVGWQEVTISGDAELMAKYGELIPVTIVDGQHHAQWRVDEQRLRTALSA